MVPSISHKFVKCEIEKRAGRLESGSRRVRDVRFAGHCCEWATDRAGPRQSTEFEPATRPFRLSSGGRMRRRPGMQAGNRMMHWLSRLTAATGIAVAILASAAPVHAEKRVALVIGNNDYKNVPKLQKAVNDARVMSDTLKQLGFNVMVAENQTRQAFSETLLAFDKAVEPGDTAFFFYAGHRFEIAGQNFLLPTDRPPATEAHQDPPPAPTLLPTPT